MDTPLCPSAQPDMPGSRLFGVVAGSVEEARVGYLAEPLPVTPELLALAEPVKPTEVFRFAAPCASDLCQHFDGARCRLATRVAITLDPAVSALPPCRIRAECRWWLQEGREACLRCPQVVTEITYPSETVHWVADPASPVEVIHLGTGSLTSAR